MFSRKVILTVDDSLTILRALKHVLTIAGYEVLQAENGIEALKIIRNQPIIHAIITDINMPQMDGITLCQVIKNEPAYKFTPVIILTTETQTTKKKKQREKLVQQVG